MEERIISLLTSDTVWTFVGALGAGSLTALAPCSLITVPLLVGSSLAMNKDLKGKQRVVYTYLFTLLFALGVIVSFSILGFIVAKFGGFFSIAPSWAYLLAAFFSILIGIYAWGWLGEVNKSALMMKLIGYRLVGGFLIGVVFGLVSTPCASAPLVAIISVAANSGYLYAYALIVTFALGHSLLLVAAGVSVGFAQSVTSNRVVIRFSEYLNKFFALMLLGIGLYFLAQALAQF